MTTLLKLKAETSKRAAPEPAVFFEDVCPKVLAVHANLCRTIGGSYAFSLSGDGGGSWTLDYGASVVHDGALPKAAVHVEMRAHDFSLWMKGALDVVDAVKTERIRVRGERKMLANLATVFSAFA